MIRGLQFEDAVRAGAKGSIGESSRESGSTACCAYFSLTVYSNHGSFGLVWLYRWNKYWTVP